MGSETDNGHVVAILSYFIIGIIWYFVDEDVQGDDLARHHVQQSLLLLVLSFSLYVVGGFLGTVLVLIPVFGWILSFIIFTVLYPLIGLGVTVLGVIGIIYAIQEKTKDIPLIGEYGRKFKIA
mgnify:CR=1 FL=1